MLINVHNVTVYRVQSTSFELSAPRRDFRVTMRSDPAVSTELLVNGRILELPQSPREEFRLPEGIRRVVSDAIEVTPLTILFLVILFLVFDAV